MTDNKNNSDDGGLAEYQEKRKKLFEIMAKDPDNVNAVIEWYDKEGDKYDAQFEKAGFSCLLVCVDKLVELLKDKNARILDVAAGTGKIGMKLKEAGFHNLDGLDGSAPMLELAKERNVYKNYYCSLVGAEKMEDIEDGIYDGACCTGGLGRGHMVLETVPTMLRALKPNGYLVFSHAAWSAQFPEFSYERLDKIVDKLKEKGACKYSEKKQVFHRPGEPSYLYTLQRGEGVLDEWK